MASEAEGEDARGRVPLWWVVLFLLLALGIGTAVVLSLGGGTI